MSEASLLRIVVVVGLTIVACDKSAGTGTELPDVDDIAAYEQELAANAARLHSAGIVVARRDVTGSAQARVADPGPAAPAAAPPSEPAPQIAPEMEGDVGGEDEPTDLDAAEADEDAPELASRPAERELVAEESAPVSRGAYRRHGRARRASRGERRAAGDRCQRVCDLAGSSCALEDRICGLADRHRGDDRYESACARAEDQCDAAAEACRACS